MPHASWNNDEFARTEIHIGFIIVRKDQPRFPFDQIENLVSVRMPLASVWSALRHDRDTECQTIDRLLGVMVFDRRTRVQIAIKSNTVSSWVDS